MSLIYAQNSLYVISAFISSLLLHSQWSWSTNGCQVPLCLYAWHHSAFEHGQCLPPIITTNFSHWGTISQQLCAFEKIAQKSNTSSECNFCLVRVLVPIDSNDCIIFISESSERLKTCLETRWVVAKLGMDEDRDLDGGKKPGVCKTGSGLDRRLELLHVWWAKIAASAGYSLIAH